MHANMTIKEKSTSKRQQMSAWESQANVKMTLGYTHGYYALRYVLTGLLSAQMMQLEQCPQSHSP